MQEYPSAQTDLSNNHDYSGSFTLFRIDRENRVEAVNHEWDGIAPIIEGQRLLAQLDGGKQFKDCFDDVSIRFLFKSLVERARLGQGATFDYRSDTAEQRRWYTMEIESPDGEIVEFRSREKKTEPMRLRRENAEEATLEEFFVRLCSWCQKVAVPPDDWLPVEAAMEILDAMGGDRFPQVTHSICPCCQKNLIAETRAAQKCARSASLAG